MSLNNIIRSTPRHLLAAVLATAALAPVTLAGPAHAGSYYPRCKGTAPDGRSACVAVTYDDYGNGTVQAFISPSGTYSRNVALQQCDGYGNNCIVISQTASSDSTSPRNVSMGHTYRGVASWRPYSGAPLHGPFTTDPLAWNAS